MSNLSKSELALDDVQGMVDEASTFTETLETAAEQCSEGTASLIKTVSEFQNCSVGVGVI